MRPSPFKFVLLLVLVLPLLLSAHMSNPQVQAEHGENNPDEMVQIAEERLIEAYLTVARADRAGADMSNLQKSLGQILSLTEQAKEALVRGDYTACLKFSEDAVQLAMETIAQAEGLEHEACYRWYLTVGYFVIGDIAVITLGVWLIYRRYKKAPSAEFMDKKPRLRGD